MENERNALLDALQSPFPGLRPFQTDESLIFFGRDEHVEEVLQRLSNNRLVAIVGMSGCGKSSLVRAGLLPALYRGYLRNATSRWRFAVFRPGSAPIDELAAALTREGGLEVPADLRARLKATSAGLSEVVANCGLAAGESLLLVVDQFEEIFRFATGRSADEHAQAGLFVSLLLSAVEQWQTPIYVVLTMRSDFLGDCAGFAGLPEALNRSQYLVPRLTREQRREAVVRPLKLVGTAPTPRLVEQLLNDAGDDPNELPVLQHAMARTYQAWKAQGARGEVDLPHYDAVGGITQALGQHGDTILGPLDADGRHLVEKIFRALTVATSDRATRRPTKLGSLHAIIGASSKDARDRVDSIVNTFAQPEHSFLMLTSATLEPGTVIDITHESLIAKWPVLSAWVKEETRSAEWYGDLTRDVVRYRTGDAGLWHDPDLARIIDRRAREGWNAAWALQYCQSNNPPYEEASAFLDASVKAQAEERRKEEVQRERELVQAQRVARAQRIAFSAISVLLITVIIGVVLVYQLRRERRQAESIEFAKVQRASSESELRAKSLEEQLKQLVLSSNANVPPASPGATVANQNTDARLEKLTRDYTLAQQQAEQTKTELEKVRKDKAMSSSDYIALVKRIDDLQSELTKAHQDKAALQARLDASLAAANRPPNAVTGTVTTGTGGRPTDDPDVADPPAPKPAPSRPGTKYIETFKDGVRAIDLRDWKTGAQLMREAISLEPRTDAVKQVRVYGMRVEPYAPHYYLGLALTQMANCADAAAALKDAEAEIKGTALESRVKALRALCTK